MSGRHVWVSSTLSYAPQCAALVLEEKVALIEACVGLEASVSVTGAIMIETVRAETNIFTVD